MMLATSSTSSLTFTAVPVPALYGKPNLINFDQQNGVYIISKIVDSGYLVVGKKRATFRRGSTGNDSTSSALTGE